MGLQSEVPVHQPGVEAEVLQSRLVKDPGNKSLKAQLVTIEAEISGLEAGLAKAQRFSNEDPNTSLYDLASADLYERAGRRAEALALLEKTNAELKTLEGQLQELKTKPAAPPQPAAPKP